MLGLISEEVLQDILKQTGSYDGSRPNHLVSGVFNKFDFQIRKKSEYNFSAFNNCLDVIKLAIEDDFKNDFQVETVFSVEVLKLIDLKSYKFREQSIGSQFKSTLFPEPIYIFYGYSTYYYLLNQYLGGGNLNSDKTQPKFTDIELQIFDGIIKRYLAYLQNGFQTLLAQTLSVESVISDVAEQNQKIKDTHFVAEYSFSIDKKNYKIALAIPRSFLVVLKENEEKSRTEGQKKLDPLWQKAVVNAFMKTPINLVVSLGKMDMPFEKSAQMKIGDTFTWDKENTQVSVIYEDRSIMMGTIGVVDGNFAIRVNESSR